VFEYDPAKSFPGVKSEDAPRRLHELLRSASGHTFGIKPLRSLPLEKLRLVEIAVEGLDCKACSLAAYEAVYMLEGVERATASFREGRVTALIDPAKTDRAKLEAALKKRGVEVPSRPDLSADRVKAAVAYLASDRLEGRGPGTPGEAL